MGWLGPFYMLLLWLYMLQTSYASNMTFMCYKNIFYIFFPAQFLTEYVYKQKNEMRLNGFPALFDVEFK